MRRTVSMILLISLGFSLSGCYTIAVGAAGAGAGYIYKDKEEGKKKK